MRTVMNGLAGARVPIIRKGNNFAVEIKIEKKKDEYNILKTVAAKRWNSSRSMDVDEGTFEEEEAHEEASVFAKRGQGM